jgi:hypothetical protein
MAAAMQLPSMYDLVCTWAGIQNFHLPTPQNVYSPKEELRCSCRSHENKAWIRGTARPVICGLVQLKALAHSPSITARMQQTSFMQQKANCMFLSKRKEPADNLC